MVFASIVRCTMKAIRTHLTTVTVLLTVTLCVREIEGYLESTFCRDPGTFQNGKRVPSDSSKPYQVGTVIRFHCNTNYKLANDGQPKIQCKADGTWTGKVPRCVAESCLENPPEVTFAILIPSLSCSQPYSIGCQVKYSCFLGYRPVGDPVKTCHKDGNWTQSGNFHCQRIQCPLPPLLSHGTRSFDSLNFSSVVTYKCDDGYYLKGTSTRQCVGTGLWSGSTLVCNIKCKEPVAPDHGQVTVSHHDFKNLIPGKVAVYTCSERYKIDPSGSSHRTCGVDGHWRGIQPKCVLYKCEDLEFPAKQVKVTLSSTGNHIGTRATFSCWNDYWLQGVKTRTCLPSGIWSDENPTCRAIECREPAFPRFGTVTGKPGKYGMYKYGSKVTYSCSIQFYVWGNSTRMCAANADGRSYWTGDEPECVTLTKYEENCKKRTGYHLKWLFSKPQCMPENVLTPTSAVIVNKAPRSRELDTLTIVTACAGSTLGALVILLVVLVCVRKLHRTRRFRHATFRSRRYSYDDDRVALIAAYASDVHFILPSYDEAINQVDRSPPPFDSVVNRNSDTANNNESNAESDNRGATDESRNSSTSTIPAENGGTIHIVFNPMAEGRVGPCVSDRASITELPTESNNQSEDSEQLREGTNHETETPEEGSAETFVDSRSNSTDC